MKFKFCSDGDCPLWALAGLHALSTLPAPLFRTLVTQVMEETPDDGIMEILKDTNLSSRDECARAAAVVRWVVAQASACGCGAAALARDLLVLGVPRAHAAALADAAQEWAAGRQDRVKANGSMINKVTDVAVAPGPPGSIDALKLSLFTSDALTGEQNKREVLIDKAQASLMLQELKTAYKKMEELEGN